MMNRRLVCLFAILLIIFGAFSSLQLSLAKNEQKLIKSSRALGVLYLEGDQIINAEVPPYIDKEIYINGNLTIKDGGVFKLIRSILMLNYTNKVDAAYKITVEGEFYANYSIIRNNKYQSNKYDFEFTEGSIGLIENSEIAYCGHLNKTGLLIGSDNVTFINSTLINNYIGINCQNTNTILNNCTIKNSKYVPVLCNNSNLRFEDCILEHDSDLKIIMEGSSKITLLSTPFVSIGQNIYDFAEFSEDSELYVSWWLQVKVFNDTGPLENATVTILDSYVHEVYSGSSDQFGEIKNIELIEFVQNHTDRNVTTPHSINISKNGYKEQKEELTITEDMSINRTLILFPQTGTISGYIKDKYGNIIENANVSIEINGVEYWNHSNPEGKYILMDIPAGINYTITASATIDDLPAYELGIAKNISLSAEEEIIINFTLQKKQLPVSILVISRDTPVNVVGADDVDKDTDFTIEFDYPIEFTSLKGNFSLILDKNETRGTFNSMDNTTWKKYRFKSYIELERDSNYTILIRKEVVRLDTSEPVLWEDFVTYFRTEFYPVLDFEPRDGSINIDTNNPGIFIRFHQKIKLNKISLEKSVKLYGPDNSNVPGEIKLLLNNQVQFIPSMELKGLTTYTLKIFDDLVDQNNKLIFRPGPEFTRSFTTMYVVPEITVAGKLIDKNGNPYTTALVSLKNETGTFLGSDFTDNKTGSFSITFKGEPGNYKLTIQPTKNYKLKEMPLEIVEDEFTKDLGDIELTPLKSADEGEEGFSLGQNLWWILIIIVVIIIIILIGLFAFSRGGEAPIEEEPMEVKASSERAFGRVERPITTASQTERETITAPPPAITKSTTATIPQPTPQPTPSGEATDEAQMHYVEPSEIPMVTASIYRCPNCGHKLTMIGDCFHCRMLEKYGLLY